MLDCCRHGDSTRRHAAARRLDENSDRGAAPDRVGSSSRNQTGVIQRSAEVGFGSGATVSATSTERPVLHRQRPYRCTAANWRLGPSADHRTATKSSRPVKDKPPAADAVKGPQARTNSTFAGFRR
jgi:hypothetical protein